MTIEPEATNESKPADPAPQMPASRDEAQTADPTDRSSDRRPRPTTILELLEYAYGESGRKLILARKDLHALKLDPDADEAEMALLRKSATADTLLSVPPRILGALAELGADPPVRGRILELVMAALASHPVFATLLQPLADPAAEPSLSSRQVSDAAGGTTFVTLGLKSAEEFKQATRERLRANAVTSFELFRVLRDDWPLDRFVADMVSTVWPTPNRARVAEVAAVLASARDTAALGLLARHFQHLAKTADQHTREAKAIASQQSRRADKAETENRDLAQQLGSERDRIENLVSQIAALSKGLETERTHRVVDKSHLVDDYEALRTQVIRRLSAQVELLSDGLHALRNGSIGVAEEFLDRSLSSIQGEVTRLKELDGAAQ